MIFFFNHEEELNEDIVPAGYWDILIVDDEPEIHTVTELALSGVEFWGKKHCVFIMLTLALRLSKY